MAYRLRLLPNDQAESYWPMTFPSLRDHLSNVSRSGPMIAIGAMSETGVPVGLALGGMSRRGPGELLSLFVDSEHRRQGLGRAMLLALEKRLSELGSSGIHTVWSDGLSGALAFSSLLKSCGYSQPKGRQLLLHGDWRSKIGEILREGYPKYTTPRLPSGYEMGMWKDISEEDRAFIKSRMGKPNWHPRHADPFREEAIIEPCNSLILRKEGEIVGWLVTHRTGPETARFTDLFIRRDLEKAGGTAIAVGVYSFWLQHDNGPPLFTMALELENEQLVKLITRRMGAGVRLNRSWGAGKTI